MHRYRKMLCLLLACFLTAQTLWMPALAAEAEPCSEEILEVAVEKPAETVPKEMPVTVYSEDPELIGKEIPEDPELIGKEIPVEIVPEKVVEWIGEEAPAQPAETFPVEEIVEEIPEALSAEIPEEVAEEVIEEIPEETRPLPERTYHETVPLYFQTDYPDIYYGEGTVATSGCSMASLSMVATYMTGYDYRPDELARYFAYSGDSNIARLEYGCEKLRLPYEKNWDWHVTLDALREGKIAIVLLNSASHFTHSQHFVVLTGLTEDGRILVNDPYEPNYEHWALAQGFREGFTEDLIVCGFQGAWIFDRFTLENGEETAPYYYYEEEPHRLDFGPVPLYYQNDYPDTRYAGGTVATSGCSVTSLAMVATYLTGHEYLPDELARYFGGRAENHMARIEMGSDILQLPYEKNTNWHVTLQALRDGKIAIVLVNSKSHFTKSQHFLVLTGLTSDGKVLVNDSWEDNYSHWALADGFVNGFDPDAILCGFEGAWVYDPADMSEDPFIYYEPAPVRGESRYGVKLTIEEEDMLAKLVWAEARGEGPEGQQAVAEVALNRLVSPDYANSLAEVIYGFEQFRGVPYMEDAILSQAQYEAVEAALYGPNILPMDVYYFATWETNPNVWGQIENHIFCYAE